MLTCVCCVGKLTERRLKVYRVYPLVMIHIAIENGRVERVSFPIKNGDFLYKSPFSPWFSHEKWCFFFSIRCLFMLTRPGFSMVLSSNRITASETTRKARGCVLRLAPILRLQLSDDPIKIVKWAPNGFV